MSKRSRNQRQRARSGNPAAGNRRSTRQPAEGQEPVAEPVDPGSVGLRAASRAWWLANRRDLGLVAVLWLVSVLLFWWLADLHVTLRRYQDEFLYWGTAQSFAHGHGLEWRGVGEAIRSPLYIWYIAIGFLPGWGVLGTYKAIHFLNAFVMPAVVFPAFFLTRHYASRGWAWVVALLCIAAPAMNYAGIIGTENLAYPISTLALAAMIVGVFRPERRYWVIAAAMIVLAALTRTQFYIFAAAYPASIVLAGVLQDSGARIAFLRDRREPLLLFAALAALVTIGLFAFPDKLLGIYAPGLAFPKPSVGELFYWIKGFTGDLFLLAGIAPTIAALALAVDRRNWRDPRMAALLAVILTVSVLLVAQVAWFSASNPYDWRARHIFYERYLFYVGPLLFVALAAFWGRARLLPVIVATGIATIILSVFDANNVLVPFSYDSFGLTLIGEILEKHPGFGHWLGFTLALIAVGVGLLLAAGSDWRERWRRPCAYGVTALVLFVLAFGQGRTWHIAHVNSVYSKEVIPQPVDFIDRSTKLPVGMIITSTDAPDMYYSTEFWNKRVVRAFLLPDSPIVYSPTCKFDLAPDGAVLATGCDFVPRAYYLRSQTLRITFRGQRVVEPRPDVRLLIAPPLPKVAGIVTGRDVVSGHIDAGFQVRSFSAGAGQLAIKVTESAHPIQIDGRKYSLPPGGTTLHVPVPAGDHTAQALLVGGGSATIDSVVLTDGGGRPISLSN